jgi:hypothetical protein
MIIVYVSRPVGFNFDELEGGYLGAEAPQLGSGGEAPSAEQSGWGGRRTPHSTCTYFDHSTCMYKGHSTYHVLFFAVPCASNNFEKSRFVFFVCALRRQYF